MHKELQARYGMDYEVHDAAVRVVVTIRPVSFVAVRDGTVVS